MCDFDIRARIRGHLQFKQYEPFLTLPPAAEQHLPQARQSPNVAFIYSLIDGYVVRVGSPEAISRGRINPVSQIFGRETDVIRHFELLVKLNLNMEH